MTNTTIQQKLDSRFQDEIERRSADLPIVRTQDSNGIKRTRYIFNPKTETVVLDVIDNWMEVGRCFFSRDRS